MRFRLAVLPVLATLVAAVAVAPSSLAAQAAPPDCTYTPKLPARVVVNAPTVTFHTPVKITGKGCAANFGATIELAHGSDSHELAWEYNSKVATNSVLPITVQPGVYKTVKSSATCSVTSGDGMLTCAVEAGSTVIKYGGTTSLSAERLSGSKHDKVQFTAKARRYDQYEKKYVTTTVDIQRYNSNSGKWHTIHSQTTKGKHGYVWTHSDSDKEHYRAVSVESSKVFSDASPTVKI